MKDHYHPLIHMYDVYFNILKSKMIFKRRALNGSCACNVELVHVSENSTVIGWCTYPWIALPPPCFRGKWVPPRDEEVYFTRKKKRSISTDPIFQSLMFGRYWKCRTYLKRNYHESLSQSQLACLKIFFFFACLGYGLVLWWYLGAKWRDTRCWSHLGGLAQRSPQMEPDQFESTLRRWT